MSEKYTVKEIRRHNQINDLWIVLHGEVFDLTNFLKEHPGGEEVLINLAGVDGSECFEEVGHSEEAKLLKNLYKIGKVESSVSENVNYLKKEPEKIDDNWACEEPKKESITFFYFMGVAVLIYAIIFYYIIN